MTFVILSHRPAFMPINCVSCAATPWHRRVAPRSQSPYTLPYPFLYTSDHFSSNRLRSLRTVFDDTEPYASRLESKDKSNPSKSQPLQRSATKEYLPGGHKYEDALDKIRHDDSPRRGQPVSQWIREWDEKWRRSSQEGKPTRK